MMGGIVCRPHDWSRTADKALHEFWHCLDHRGHPMRHSLNCQFWGDTSFSDLQIKINLTALMQIPRLWLEKSNLCWQRQTQHTPVVNHKGQKPPNKYHEFIAKLEQACSGDCWGAGSQGDRLVPKSYLLGSSRELGCQGTVAQQACSL